MAKSKSEGSSAGTSTQQVLTAIITNGVIFAVFVSIFLLLRLNKKFRRIYAPKSSYNLINDEKKPDPLPKGLWQWFLPLLKKSDNFVLQQAGIDGYFFLRYLFIISMYCLFSMCYMFPILFPVNAANGHRYSGLDQLAYSDVKHSARYYAHTFLSWVFFWGFLFVVYRELYFYTSMRQAILSSPRYAKKLSSRTVLFQTVPQDYLMENDFNKLVVGAKKIWIARADPELVNKVNERQKMAMKLEGTLTSFISSTVKKINKKKLNENGAQSISNNIMAYNKKAPQHRLKFLIGEKVDTIEYLKTELPKIDEEVKELQSKHDEAKPWNSVYVEFESQYQAQMAYQSIPHSHALRLNPIYIGIEPNDIVWFNMRMFWWERLGRKTGATAAIVALVILWAFPVAFVGMVSNVTYLTKNLKWLRWINNMPKPLLGIITSLAPTVALAVLMSLLPIFIRKMAVTAGAPSAPYIEYFTQQSYFAFQVIQVFLITTLASSATSTVTEIVNEPSKAMSLLASNLPKSSNFFISYTILQGFSIAGGALAQLVPLILFYVLGYLLDKTARKKYTRFSSLSSMSWGTTFPVYTNLAVIIFSYAVISPIILLFGFVGFLLLYIAYLYSLTYVCQESPDGRGMYYPRALFQTLVGVYIGQVCLLGLFVVGKGWGPIVLEVVCICVTVFIHTNLSAAFDKLNTVVPVDCMKPLDGKSDTPSFVNIYNNHRSHRGGVVSSGDDNSLSMERDDIKELPKFQVKKYQPRIASHGGKDQQTSVLTDYTFEVQQQSTQGLPFNNNENNILSVPLLADGDTDPMPAAPAWKKLFYPHIYASYKAVKSKLPNIYQLKDPNEIVDTKHAYDLPAVAQQCPIIWIPKDPYGFSTVFIEELAKCNIQASDDGAFVNEQGKLVWELDSVPPDSDDYLEPESQESDLKDDSLDNESTGETTSVDKANPFV
ncbi:hypothetical protein ACO0QE_003826 [Hanseniaspora vineae]